MVRTIVGLLLGICACDGIETEGATEFAGFSWRAGSKCGDDSKMMVVGQERHLTSGWTCLVEPREHEPGYETMAVQCWDGDQNLRFLTSCESSSPFGHAEIELGECTVSIQCRQSDGPEF